MGRFPTLWTPPGLSRREVRGARLKLAGGIALWLVFGVLAAIALAACGETRRPSSSPLTEQNSVRLGGIDYRVIRFRELNPHLAPDRAIVTAPHERAGRAYYAAV